MIKGVILPQLGQTMVEGNIIEWMVAEGDRVERGDPLFSFESDKANLDVEAPIDGIVRKILAKAGETRPVLSLVAVLASSMEEDISSVLKESGVEADPSKAVKETFLDKESRSAAPDDEPETPDKGRIVASPRAKMLARKENIDLAELTGSGSGGRIIERDVLAHLASFPKVTPIARRLAEEMGVDLAQVKGSGPGGKITRTDVESAQAIQRPTTQPVEPIQAPAPQAAQASQEPAVSGSIPMAGLRKVIADRMSLSAHSAARVTLMTEVDATKFVELRTALVNAASENWGFRPGYNELLVSLVAKALREHPRMNAILDGNAIKELELINIGLAVDADRGLKVVVVRGADKKGLRQLGMELEELVGRALSDQSLPEELSGGTFTITNLGMFGIDGFTPIMNPPETGILGVGRIIDKPAVFEGQMCIRAMLSLSLSFDHRVIDGAPAARFLQRVAKLIQEPVLLLA